jgi:8-oxo-dGTP pyrophosphatase MutT (NUDIX family)
VTRFAFSSAAYLRCAGAILLVHHKRLDQWVPVGGELDPGETPWAGVVREVWEETGFASEWWRDRQQLWTPPEWERTAASVMEHPLEAAYYLGYDQHGAGSKGVHGTFSYLLDVPGRAFELCDEHRDCAWVSGWASAVEDSRPLPPNVKRYLTRIFHGGR